MKLTLIFLLLCNACYGQLDGKLMDSIQKVMRDSGWSSVSLGGTNSGVGVVLTWDSMYHGVRLFPKVGVIYIDSLTNIPPIALAGKDQIISPKTKTVKLKGIGIDEDGTIVAYYWKQIYGDKVIIKNPTFAETTVTGITGWGIYIFQLTVTDNNGDTGKDNVMIKVQYF